MGGGAVAAARPGGVTLTQCEHTELRHEQYLEVSLEKPESWDTWTEGCLVHLGEVPTVPCALHRAPHPAPGLWVWRNKMS